MGKIIKEISTNETDKVRLLSDLENQLIDEKILGKQNSLKKDIEFREEKGNLEIYPKVLLPHIKQQYVKKSKIIIIKNHSSLIKWGDQMLKVVILVLVSNDISENEQKRIRIFMRDLADETYINKLIEEGAM
ncbi:PTS sugar transporter subunit IIA [Staphylococcus equorum]|uniref:PTS sugar transporter subunit IIA n=1 Tax=Staphylococcus equorum TaxID=246432 RepID=UPI0008FB9B0C|nr:PTS sugar transporter subunit IIA [Staphylococcus equorum]OIS61471.1 hypothetical protein A4A34_02950 [Staphylococcus equorum]